MELENKEKKMRGINLFSYILIFFTSMGGEFLNFSILGVHFNCARILMIFPIFIIIFNIIKTRKVELNITNKNVKYCIIFLIIWSIYSIITIYKVEDMYYYLIKNFFICIGTIDILFFIKYINIEKNKNKIFNIITIAVLINCIYYLYSYFIQNMNIGGFYHNSNDLATALLIAIPISIYLIKQNKQIILKMLAIVELVVFSVCFLNIQSRACILGVCLAIFIYIILKIVKERKKIIKSKLLIVCIVIMIGILIIIGTNIAIKYIGKISFKPIEHVQNSNDIRANIIFNGLHFLQQDNNWLMGIGAGNAEYYMQHYGVYDTRNIYSFHNPILEIVVTYGLLIFIGFLVMCFKIFKELIKKFYRNSKLITTNNIFLIYFIAMIIANISSSGIFTREWFWIFLALTICWINYEKNEEIERKEDKIK